MIPEQITPEFSQGVIPISESKLEKPPMVFFSICFFFSSRNSDLRIKIRKTASGSFSEIFFLNWFSPDKNYNGIFLSKISCS
jgi:hypothetical protein